MPYQQCADARVFYEFEPKAGSPVLMLSNSLGTRLSMWDAQMAALKEHFSVLRYDTRGHGNSSVPPGPYSIEQMALDAITLLDALGLERVHFCGLSMGGMTGQRLAAQFPHRIERLVLCNTAAKIGTAASWNERIAMAQREGMAAIVPRVLERWFTASFRRDFPEVVEATGAMLLASSAEGYAASCAAVRDMDQRASLASIAAPTLVVYGTEDEVTPPADAAALIDGIRGAQSLALPAAHLSNIEAAAEFTRGVLGFLEA